MADTPEPCNTQPASTNKSSLSLTTLKCAFKLKKSENSDISKSHHDLLIRINDLDPDAKFVDSQDNFFIPSNVRQFRTKFNYEIFQRKHFQLVCVAHKMSSSVSLTDLKTSLRNVLLTKRVSITVHTWPTLDTRDVGWLLHSHPRFHNRDNIHKIISTSLNKVSQNKPVPKFRLYVKSITHGNPNEKSRIATQAIHIECESSKLHELRELLHQLYHSTDKSIPGKFIPMNFPHIQSAHDYMQLLRSQSMYMDNHRNISVTGLTSEELDKHITTNNTSSSIRSILQQSKHIMWISETNTSEPQQWNFSTTSEPYHLASSLIHTNILDKISTTKSNMKLLHSNNAPSEKSITITTQSYLQALTTSISKNTSQSFTSPTYTESTKSPVSSLSKSLYSKRIELANMKEHITRSITLLQKEFKNFQSTLRNELKNQISDNIRNIPESTSNHEMSSTSPNLQDSITSLRNKFDQFRTAIRQELKDQLLLTVTDVVKTTTNQISTIITKEVQRALQMHLQALSPRHRKPKRNRAPNISDDNLSQRLFHDNYPSSPDDIHATNTTRPRQIHDTHQFEQGNELFEVNMTVQPDRSTNAFSDTEVSIASQHP